MKSHTEVRDVEFVRQFETCQLPPEIFNHEAHIRLAWIYLNRLGQAQAISKMDTHLKQYVRHHGAPEKYNVTLTIAAVKAVDHFRTRSEAKDFISFIRDHKQLLSHFRELLQSHYTMDIFSLKKARKQFIAPDLSPFD